MDVISEGMTGAAVEDVQTRLLRLGFRIDADEIRSHTFGAGTVAAVRQFRARHNLPDGFDVDSVTWSILVDEGYHMGDRTLYLRLPNFHGNDVRMLQNALNTLGFSCGDADGYYGAHTEAAVKQFQENVGLFADGMAFQDTFEAIWRLHHVWGGKPADGPHPSSAMGFARAASVLEDTRIGLAALDPVARSVAGRMWNLASATSEQSGLYLANSCEPAVDATALIVLTNEDAEPAEGVVRIELGSQATLARRIRDAVDACELLVPVIQIDLPYTTKFDGSFTVNDAQTSAVVLLDAVCAAFDR
jgi:peptidoglycan hydrolase-like protein with peptidoglycan-binding domain